MGEGGRAEVRLVGWSWVGCAFKRTVIGGSVRLRCYMRRGGLERERGGRQTVRMNSHPTLVICIALPAREERVAEKWGRRAARSCDGEPRRWWVAPTLRSWTFEKH